MMSEFTNMLIALSMSEFILHVKRHINGVSNFKTYPALAKVQKLQAMKGFKMYQACM